MKQPPQKQSHSASSHLLSSDQKRKRKRNRMGFPLGYSELLLPKLLLQLVFLLGFIRRVISWAFNLAGLGDLLDSDAPWPDSSSLLQIHHHHHHYQFPSLSAILIQELLPSVRFHELRDPLAADSCAVCLYEFDPDDEVRRLTNCRHVFHRPCLDRWLEHDQRTCPLCRTPLVPDDMRDSFNDRIWAAAALPDSYSSAADLDALSPSSFTAHHHHLIS